MGMLYDLSLLCGRMQHIHVGHNHLIDMGLMTSDRLLLLLGSAQESGTEKNPFSFETRAGIIRMIYQKECNNGRLIIKPLNDMTNGSDITPVWGRYVLDHCRQYMGTMPDMMIYGNDESRSSWFDKEDIKDMMEIIVPRSRINVSATQMREYIVRNDFNEWTKLVHPKLQDKTIFDNIRKSLASVPFYENKIRQLEVQSTKKREQA